MPLSSTTNAALPNPKPMLVLICGPYLSGTNGDPARIAANRAQLESWTLPIYERGHLPLISEWMAMPIIHAAGGQTPGDDVFNAYQYPVAHRLLERCDAIFRIPGASRGADMDVARAQALGLAVFTNIEQLPCRSSDSESAQP